MSATLSCPKCGRYLGEKSSVHPARREWCEACNPSSDEPSGPNIQHTDWRPGDRPVDAPAEDPMLPPDELIDSFLLDLDATACLVEFDRPRQGRTIRDAIALIRKLRPRR